MQVNEDPMVEVRAATPTERNLFLVGFLISRVARSISEVHLRKSNVHQTRRGPHQEPILFTGN